MKNTVLLSVTLLSISMLNAADPVKVIDWNRLPNVSENINPKVLAAVTAKQWFWTESRGPASFEVFFLNPVTHERDSFLFTDKAIKRVGVLAYALKPNDFVVISAVFDPVEGKSSSGFIIVDIQARTFRIIDTGKYFPRNPAVSSDGSIWTVGWDRTEDPRKESTADFPVIRIYDKTGKLIRSDLPKSQLGIASADSASNGSRTFTNNDGFIAYLAPINTFIEYSSVHAEAKVYSGPPMAGKVRTIGLAKCDGERLFFNAMSNQANYAFMRNAGGQWEKLAFHLGGIRQDWLPMYPYCGDSKRPVALLTYTDASEVNPRMH